MLKDSFFRTLLWAKISIFCVSVALPHCDISSIRRKHPLQTLFSSSEQAPIQGELRLFIIVHLIILKS